MATARFTMSRKIPRARGITMTPKVPVVPRPSAPVAAPPAVAPPPFNPNVLPPDAAYDQQLATLGRSRDTTLAGLATQRQGNLLSYGYTQDQSGGLAFDPTNPYSQAAILKRNYEQSRRGTGVGLAAQGQLYSGAYQTAQDYGNQQELQASDALQKRLLAFLAQNTAGAAQAGSAYEQGVGQAGSERLSRAIELYRMMVGG
jgi:hypothetical protein